MLDVRSVSASYGNVVVLQDVSLNVGRGEMVALVGVNGAGKTTLMKCISGLHAPSAGRVSFNGDELVGRGCEAAVTAGISLVPEGRMVFPRMSVLENLLLGASNPRARPQRDATLRRVFDLFPRLSERSAQHARTLSGGEQQMLAIGRGLMSIPDLLILDEPSLGLSPLMVQETFRALRRLNGEGLTMLLVEQNVRLSLAVSTRGYVIENGRIVLTGSAGQLAEDPLVRKAYLGV